VESRRVVLVTTRVVKYVHIILFHQKKAYLEQRGQAAAKRRIITTGCSEPSAALVVNAVEALSEIRLSTNIPKEVSTVDLADLRLAYRGHSANSEWRSH